MDIATKISAMEEFYTRQHTSDALKAAHAAGIVKGLKASLSPDFNYDDALIEASTNLQNLLKSSTASSMEIEHATGYFSGIIFSETHDIFKAQEGGYQEREALKKMLESGHF